MTEDRAVSLNAVIKAVDQHTNDDGILDDDISCILEDLPSITLDLTPCDDAVSRETILNKIKEVCFSKDWIKFRIENGSNGQRDYLFNFIKQLPSVNSQSIYEERKESVRIMQDELNAISRILNRMWNCRGKNTTSIDKVKMEQIIRDELSPVKPQDCDQCEVGNPCLYCEYEFKAKADDPYQTDIDEAMTSEEAINRLKEEIDDYTPFAEKWNEARLDIKALNMAIKALEQEPCEDAISRQAVLGIVDSYSESQSNVEDVTQDIISDIVVLPSVKPKEERSE